MPTSFTYIPIVSTTIRGELTSYQTVTDATLENLVNKDTAQDESLATLQGALAAKQDISGLGGLALKSTVSDADVASSAAIAQSKIQGLSTTISSAIIGHEATTNHPIATASVKGLLSAADKIKLDGVAAAATANATDAYLLTRPNQTGTQDVSTITGLGALATKSTVADPDITSVSSAKVAGLSTTISSAVVSHEATVNHPTATTTAKGFLSAVDKTKLDGVAPAATANAPDAFLLNRKNQTDTQHWNTISSTPTTVSGYGITDAATLVSGKIPTSQLPNDYLVNTATVSTQTQMLALDFQQGDFCYRSDVSAYFDLNGTNPTVLGDWQRRQASSVRSVNGQTVPDIVLGAGDIGADVAGTAATVVASHAASTNHPVVSTSANGMMSSASLVKLNGIANNATANSTDVFLLARVNQTGTQDVSTITGLGTLATKSTINDADVATSAAIASSKIAGLGALATKSLVANADIAAGAAIAQSKISGLTASLSAKQDLLTVGTNISVNNLTIAGKRIETPASSQVLTATGVVTIATSVVQVSAAADLTVTTASPLSAGVDGQQITLFNSGTKSIYFNALLLGLRPKACATLLYAGGAWNLVTSPQLSPILGKNQKFVFTNGASVSIADDYTIFLFNSANVQQSQEYAALGTKVDFTRGIAIYNDGGFGTAGYYKYTLGSNNFVLPAVSITSTEYGCF